MTEPRGRLRLEWAGGTAELLSERALFREGDRTLFIADLHLGKDQALRSGGLPIPPGSTEDDLGRLGALLDREGAERLVVLGDFLHARTSRAPEILERLRSWRADRDRLEIVLVRGNHDRSAGDPPADLGIRSVDPPWTTRGWAAVHDPVEADTVVDRPVLAGHLHPAVRLLGPGGDRLKVPAFVLRSRSTAAPLLLLPAFSLFTGGALLPLEREDRVWVTSGEQLLEVPTRRAGVR